MAITRRTFPWMLAVSCAATARAQKQTLTIHLTSAGKPTVARVYITDRSGKRYRIEGAAGYSRGGEVHSIVDRQASVSLAPGTYTVRAEKGTEFGAAEETLELGVEPVSVTLDVRRVYDMNARGWYSGDLHIHRSPEEMPLLIRAEELNVAPVITRHVGGPQRSAPPPFPDTNVRPVDPTHVVGMQNQEVERLYNGHGAVLLLNMPEPVPDRLHDLFPMDIEFCRRARAQGGFVDGEKPIWKNVPVNVAFGALDAIGIVNNHFHPHDTMLDAEKYGSMERLRPEYQTVAGFAAWMLDLYYSFLNCGFRIPVSAGSASGIMPSWVGYERVYVRLSGAFTYEQWFRDLKAGQSMATNGPLLLAEAAGRPPGGEFAWTGPVDLKVQVEVYSREPVERVEAVLNGRVMASGKFSSVRITEPGWLAFRCFGRPGGTLRYAHSSPFYFLENGRMPVQSADARRWADYVHGLAGAARETDYPSAEAYRKAQETFRKAESVYRGLVVTGCEPRH